MRVPLPALTLATLMLGGALPFPASAGPLSVPMRSGAATAVDLATASTVSPARASQDQKSPQLDSSAESDEVAYPEQGPSLGGLLLRAAGALALMTVLALAAAIFAKRYMPGLKGFSAYGTSRVQLLESKRITSRLTLFVVEFDGRRFLLAQSGDRIVEVGARGHDSQMAGG